MKKNNNFFKNALFVSITVLVVTLIFTVNNVNEHLDVSLSTISTEGTETITYEPDKAKLVLAINLEGPHQNLLQKDAATTSSQVEQSLKQYGIKDKDIKTNYLNVQEVNKVYHAYQDIDLDDDKSYQLSTTLEVDIKDLDVVEELTNELIRIENVSIHQLRYEAEDIEKIKEKALAAATANARSKADKMAKSLKVDIVGVASVSNNSGGYGVFSMKTAEVATMDAVQSNRHDGELDISFYEGKDEVTVKVNVDFYIK